jgi:adenylate cyclase
MTMDKTKRKLIAVVHADVKGYSRMMGEDDEYTVRTLASNRQEMYRLVELHEGQVRDIAGDGFLVEFSSVVAAVKFSVEFQGEMKKRNANIPEAKKMEFRIGVNIGDVIHDRGTLYQTKVFLISLVVRPQTSPCLHHYNPEQSKWSRSIA